MCARLQTNEDIAIPAQKPSFLELRTTKLIFTFQVSQVISASMLHIRLFIIRSGSLKGTLKQNEIITYCLGNGTKDTATWLVLKPIPISFSAIRKKKTTKPQ